MCQLEKLLVKIIHRPVAVSVIFGAVVVAGLFAAWNLPLEILPSVDYPRLHIMTYWYGASPQAIEAYVTSLIEGEVATVPGVVQVNSYSYQGYSQIVLRLQKNADVDFIHFTLQEKLSFLMDKFPEGVLPPRIVRYVPKEFKATRFMSYHIVGSKSDARLRELALKKVCPVLNSIPGVAGSEVIGGRERQIHILFDREKLRQLGVNPSQITRVVRQAGFAGVLGEIIDSGARFSLVFTHSLQSLHDIENLPITFLGQHWVLVKDVAQVVDTCSSAFSIQRINGQATVLIAIEREPQQNTIQVANRVYRVVEKLQKKLPAGVRLIKEDDQSIEIRQNVRQLFYRATFSFLIILLVLSLFLKYVRFTFVVQLSILISVLFTLLFMFVFRISLNLITLAGLALGFGILVDNSIVVLENIHHSLRSGVPIEIACTRAPSEMFLPVLASTLTTVVALLPFLYLMEGLKIYYAPFAVTVSLALIASVVVAFLLIPTTAFRWLRAVSAHAVNNWDFRFSEDFRGIRWLEGFYRKFLNLALSRPWLTLFLTVWLFGLPVWKIPEQIEMPEGSGSFKSRLVNFYNQVMESEFIQDARPYINYLLGGSIYLFYRYVDKGEIWQWGEKTYVRVVIRLPSGTAIEETDRVTRALEKRVLGMEGIHQVRSRIYPHYAFVQISFTPKSEHSLIPFLVKERLIHQAARMGNASISVTGYGPGFHSGGEAFTLQNRLLLTGYNYRELTELARGIKEQLERNPRVINVRTDLTRQYYRSDLFESSLRFERERLSFHLLTVSEVHRQLQPLLSRFLYRQRLRLGWQEVPFIVVARQYQQFQFYQLPNVRIRNRLGQETQLNQLALIGQRRIPPVIERENQQYFQVIAFDYLAPSRYAKMFLDGFLANLSLPAGYSIKKMEMLWWESEEKQNMTNVLLIALILMYMILAGLYESFTYPFLIFLVIPLSLIGIFFIYYFTDTTFDQSAYIGVIFLFGIVLNNAIILLAHVNQLKQSGKFTRLKPLLIQAGTDRLRPILMTSLTTIAGLLPLILLKAENRSADLWMTLSLSTVGGLTSATILGIIILPVLVLIVEKSKFFLSKIFTH